MSFALRLSLEDRAVRDLSLQLPMDHPKRLGEGVEAQLLALLAETGRFESAAGRERLLGFYRRRNSLSLFARALLLRALHESKLPERESLARELSATLIPSGDGLRALEPPRSEKWTRYDSAERTNAALLYALVPLESRTEVLDGIARGLLSARASGRWRTTHSNAWALLALREYYRKVERVPPQFVAGA